MAQSFWAKKIADEMPKPPPAPRSPLTPWWSPPPAYQPPQQPAQSQPAYPEQQAKPGETVIQPSDINLNRFQSIKAQSLCPGCGSSNYMTVSDARSMRPVTRCFDCGYPVVQTTSGMSNVSGTGGGSAPARQTSTMTITSDSGRVLGTTQAATGAKGQSNYNPQNVSAGRLA